MRAMLGLVAVALLSAADPVDVVVSRSIATTPERAQDLLERVTEALAQAGLKVRAPAETRRLLPAGTQTAACAARRPCVRELGVALGARAVVGVDVGHVTGQMAVNLEAVLTADGQRLAQHSFAIDSDGYPARLAPELEKFSRALALALPPEDAPVAAKLEPSPVKEPPVAVVAEAARPVGPIVLGSTAVLAAVVAVSLAMVGASTGGQLERAKSTHQGLPASTLSRSDAEAIAASANGQYTAAAIAGGAALTLGAGALLWWGLGSR